jgi:hypothetical protein
MSSSERWLLEGSSRPMFPAVGPGAGGTMSLRDPNPSRKSAPKRVAIVIANPATSSTTGWPVGFWWSELTHPYLAFHEVGYEVDVFSPFGG